MTTPHTLVITGAAGALGQATARHLMASGHRVALLDQDEARLKAVFGSPADALLLAANVTSAESVAAAVQRVAQAFTRIDALVHIAGGFEMGEPVHQISRASWDRMMDLNAWSFVNVTQAVVPLMKRQGGGSVVAVSANAAREGQALKGAYCAAKSALQRLVEALSHEVAAEGIRVNSVAPTTLDTPANRQGMPGADRSAWVALDAAAQAIAFLATPAGMAVHGQHLQLGRS
ncbi:MAG TPA: SDR family oxidoreductase [Rhizobacter sp.]|nr:SDR family oxidoreductase [Rhizobacter sp.]